MNPSSGLLDGQAAEAIDVEGAGIFLGEQRLRDEREGGEGGEEWEIFFHTETAAARRLPTKPTRWMQNWTTSPSVIKAQA